MLHAPGRVLLVLALPVLLAPAAAAPAAGTDKVRVLATTTDLAALAREVGGAAVEVDCLTRGPEDPHFLDARPSFVRLAHDADLFLKTGLDLEAGWEVPIVRDARNPRIQPGSPGHCDASAGIDLLEVPAGPVDRSSGDVHGRGNPHYLLDPVRAKTAAGTIAAALAAVDPPRAPAFREGAEAFSRRVDEALLGRELLEHASASRLARMLAEGRLGVWLDGKGLRGKEGGWSRRMLPHAGASVVAHHASFSYLLDRFHVGTAALLEPRPGVPPTPRHLKGVAETVKERGLRAILCTVFNPKDVPRALAGETGARVVVLAHMPGALEAGQDYLSFVDANVRALAAALDGEPR